MSYFDSIESKTDRMRMKASWEYDKKAIRLITGVGAIVTISYYISTKEIQLNESDLKSHNNIEAILVTEDHIKRISNPGIKIKDTDRSDSEKSLQKKYSRFVNNTHNNYNHNNRKMQIPTRVNEYASNNTGHKFFPNDRRQVQRYTLKDW